MTHTHRCEAGREGVSAALDHQLAEHEVSAGEPVLVCNHIALLGAKYCGDFHWAEADDELSRLNGATIAAKWIIACDRCSSVPANQIPLMEVRFR